ncbi:unnamed protein product [Phytophthora fragariaefolia]|uniref:Unnamed protein product n=1 Tax=Phytophthora fragariaefolia TaxID=1490495 RepID=A0A9W6U2Y1_9STRA|nr:unnamed protein product [Phytophthora fragariaefolia]
MEAPGTRPALLPGGVALASLGLLPLLELGVGLHHASSAEQLRLLLALTPLDKSALALSGLLALSGAALLALHWADVPAAAARRAARPLAAFLALAALADAALLASAATRRDPESPWSAQTYAEHEGRFETQMNRVFCHAKGRQLCQLGSVAEARQVFPLRGWPVDSDRAPGRRVATSCEGFKHSVQLWGYQDKMQLCRLCANVTSEQQQLQDTLGATYSAQVLAAVEQLSLGELQWCGEYLVDGRAEHDVGHSPYWKHRREFQSLLVYDTPPFSLLVVARVLQLLEVVATAVCVALLRWAWALGALKIVDYSKDKVDVVRYLGDVPRGG